jgi:hypothetical protein
MSMTSARNTCRFEAPFTELLTNPLLNTTPAIFSILHLSGALGLVEVRRG